MRTRETRQKQIIEEEMRKFREFFDADTLHKQVQVRDKNIGTATTYRFLKDSATQGRIHSYACNRRTIYSLNEKSHCHFTCENCGNTTHFTIRKLDFLKEKVKSQICHVQIDVTGICDKCRKKIELQ